MTGLVPAGVLAHGELASTDSTPASIETLRWSTHGYTSSPADTPASTHWPVRILGDVDFEQAIHLGSGVVGRAALGFGEVALWDGDADLAVLLEGYAIDGRALRLRVADGTGARIGAWPATAAFSTVFAGSTRGWRRDEKSVRIRLRDAISRLDVPVQTDVYTGAGGLNGPPQLKGLPKPQSWGQVFNVPAVYLGVIDLGFGTLATFQVHFRTIKDVTAVRERGAEITRVSGTPGIGQYVAHPALGVFQLGFTPAGAITADVQGDTVGSYVFTPGKLAQRIASDICGLGAAEFDQSAFDDYDYERPGTVGVFVASDTRPRALDVVEALVGGTGGFVTQTRGGLLRVGAVTKPDPEPHAALGLADIRGIRPVDLPDGIDPPPQRVEVGFGRNYAPNDDLAGAVTGDLRASLAQPWRSAAAYDGGVAAAHVLAQQMPLFESAFADEAPAQALADELLGLYAPGRRRFRVVTGRYLGQLELGWTVAVTYPLFGLSAGWSGIIEGIREDWMRGTVELTLFG